MNHQIVMWSSVLVVLGVIFVLREAMKMRRRVSDNKLFEMSDEFDMYNWDEE